jgi:hypothetical protein
VDHASVQPRYKYAKNARWAALTGTLPFGPKRVLLFVGKKFPIRGKKFPIAKKNVSFPSKKCFLLGVVTWGGVVEPPASVSPVRATHASEAAAATAAADSPRSESDAAVPIPPSRKIFSHVASGFLRRHPWRRHRRADVGTEILRYA